MKTTAPPRLGGKHHPVPTLLDGKHQHPAPPSRTTKALEWTLVDQRPDAPCLLPHCLSDAVESTASRESAKTINYLEAGLISARHRHARADSPRASHRDRATLSTSYHTPQMRPIGSTCRHRHCRRFAPSTRSFCLILHR